MENCKESETYKNSILDHIVHPPFKDDKDPWECPMPDAKNYKIKSDSGVFNLYRDEECKDRVPYEYITLSQYIQDKNVMCTMIADGPL